MKLLETSDCLPAMRGIIGVCVARRQSPAGHAPAPRGLGAVSPPKPRVFGVSFSRGCWQTVRGSQVSRIFKLWCKYCLRTLRTHARDSSHTRTTPKTAPCPARTHARTAGGRRSRGNVDKWRASRATPPPAGRPPRLSAPGTSVSAHSRTSSAHSRTSSTPHTTIPARRTNFGEQG